MGIPLTDLTDRQKRMLGSKERKRLGKAAMTADEAQASFVARNEKELQQQIAALLRRNGIWFDQDAMHKRRTGTKGTPDFLFVCKGVPFAWEVKYGNGKLSEEQMRAEMIMERNGWHCFEVKSLESAQRILEMAQTISERSGL